MNKKVKYFLGVLCTLLFGALFLLNLDNIKADSGWDVDFDTGGSSWSGGSDWGGSSWSSSDWDSDYSHSGSSSSGSFSSFGFVVFIIIVVIIIYYLKYNNVTTTSKYIPEYKYSLIDEEYIKKYIDDFNKQKFLDDAYQIYLDTQKAWSNFDTKSLRNLLTDELFNTYNMQLKALKAKKQKNIMSDFALEKIDTTAINVSNNQITMKVVLEVSFFDYVVDISNNVLRGNKNHKVSVTYELTFVSTINKKETKNCPSCGAPINKNSASNVCEYCNSTLVKNTYSWVLAKKENKRQEFK